MNLTNPMETFNASEQMESFVVQQGFPPREVTVRNLMFNDVQKIVKNIFRKPFVGDARIEKHLMSSVLNPQIQSFFDLVLEVMITGRKTVYIVDSKAIRFDSRFQADADGLRLRGSSVEFCGFLDSLPAGVHPQKIDPQLVWNIDMVHHGTFRPLVQTLEPLYHYMYNILINLNYALMVANTPQIKLNHFRDLMTQNSTTSGLSARLFSFENLKKQMTQIKKAFQRGGGGQKAVFIDAGDKISFDLPNMDGYAKANEILQEWIANGLDAPVSYLFGRAPQGMNATGDKDHQQWNDLAEFWYKYLLQPMFDHISGLFGYEPSRLVFSVPTQ